MAKQSHRKKKLTDYRRKRDPQATTEPFSPEPTSSTGAARQGNFVVHLHDARRRHWDLRIEMGGVLKSFAVPRGPSLDPKHKRLAVETEDHPLTYLDFEDVIPSDNYGAGPMIIWDLGRIQYLEQAAEDGYEAGKIDFQLFGHKLRGRFALVKTSGRGRRAETKQPEWLLLKKTDAHARPDSLIVEEQPRSVLSGLTVEELVDRERVAADIVAQARALGAEPGVVDSRRLVPMACTTEGGSLQNQGWWYELKLDGVRIIADKRPEGAHLFYRTGRPATQAFPELTRAVASLAPSRIVLDGEIIALDETGRPSFQRLARRLHVTHPTDIRFAKQAVPASFVAFDVLALEELDLRPLPLHARRQVLERIIQGRGRLRTLDYLEDDGQPLYDFCRAHHLEGLVAKRADSPYQAGPTRSPDWVKVKCEREDDFVIVGYSHGTGSRKRLGALHLASYERGDLVIRGRVGSGLDEATIDELLEATKSLATETCPALGECGTKDNAFLQPSLVASVRYMGWTDEGRLRMPTLRGLRNDVEPQACTAAPRSADDAIMASEVSEPTLERAKPVRRRVRLTNQTKVFWPDDGYTKGDLCNYYEAVAPVILPYLSQRPMVMVRYPDGIDGKWFYQWRIPPGAPSWVRVVPHRTEEDDGKEKATVLVDDLDTLLYVANLGCIPLHVIAARLASLEECDFLTIDFDIAQSDLRTATILANELRTILDSIELPGYPKTSGQTGLHVLIPLGSSVSFATAKVLNELLGRILVSRHPKHATMERRKEKRGDRVYVDTGQTGRSRTIVAPYSVRAFPGATVSTPLSWDEVGLALDPRQLTMFTVPDRIVTLGDPMASLLDDRPDIPNAVKKLSEMLNQ